MEDFVASKNFTVEKDKIKSTFIKIDTQILLDIRSDVCCVI